MKKKTYYMHTLDGKPAVWCDNRICPAHKQITAGEMCESLRELREHENIFYYNRQRDHGDAMDFRCDYVRVVIQ